MQILYTGADAFNRPQPISDKSLGGWLSATPIPSGRLGNIFSPESYRSYTNGGYETKAIVIVNNTGAVMNNLKFGYVYPAGYAPFFKIEVAFVTLQSPNFQRMEQIASSNDTPYYGSFVEANIDLSNSINNSVNIGNFADGAKLGIWMRRQLLPQTVLPCAQSVALPNTNEKISNVQFKFIWD